MKKIKILITFLAIIFCIAGLKGQDNIVINFTDNSDVTIAIKDIQRITFNGDNMQFKTVNGVENSYLMDDIAFISFSDNLTAIKDIPKNIEQNVYVNANGEIVVESPYQIKELTVFDLNGRKLAMGTQSILNVNFLRKGIYLLKIETTEGVVTKKFIKSK